MRIKLELLDERKNSGMIVLKDMAGSEWAIVHMDLFYEIAGGIPRGGPLYKALQAGEEVTVELTMVEEE